MDKTEQTFIILFCIWIVYLIYTNWKCKQKPFDGFPEFKTPEPPPMKVKSKFQVGDYIQDTNAPVIKKVTGFYVTEGGTHMTTVVAVENYGHKVEQRNQSSTPYSTVALNTYYKKIDYDTTK